MLNQILLVEDSEVCSTLALNALRSPTHHVTRTETLAAALNALSSQPFDLILLDLSLPDGNGMSLLNHLRSNPGLKGIPVLLLTSNAETDTKINAFELGAEDYMTKPIHPAVLKARVENRLKKYAEYKSGVASLRKGSLELDLPSLKAAIREGNARVEIELTVKEFKILYHLAKFEGHTFARTEIVKAVWGSSTHVLDRTVDSHIYGLRRKLGQCAGYVECVAGIGYRFDCQSKSA